MPNSQITPDCSAGERRDGLRSDSLAAGMSLLLILTVLQRVVGFGRNILFCRWLDPAELGQWNLSFSLVMLAAPLVVIGLPGSFGRYVEHYRTRGQLKSFLRRTTYVTIILSVLGISTICLAGPQAAWLFFGSPSQVSLLVITMTSLIAVIGFNFLVELFTALRQVKVVSYMQLSNSVLFAVLGLGLLFYWDASAKSIIVGYALACLLTGIVAVVPLVRCWNTIEEQGAPPAHRGFWAKLVPFAAWIWFTDLISNLFSAADRYMLVHFMTGGAGAATAVVGQYHSSLVVPALLLSIANMMAAVLLPYLAAAWEANDRAVVSQRLNMTMKTFGLLAMFASLSVLCMAPMIFGWALGGKYSDGMEVLPWTLAFSAWAGLAVVARSYLLCVERAGLGTAGPVLGLIVNVLLNLLWVPSFGLIGAVWATTVGNIVILAVTMTLNMRDGLRLEKGTVIVCCLPILLTCSIPLAIGLLIVLLVISVHHHWLFSVQEKIQISQWLESRLGRFTTVWTHWLNKSAA